MARSTCIYVVMGREFPIAAFTVKWEMQKWLEINKVGDYVVYRYRDGLRQQLDGGVRCDM